MENKFKAYEGAIKIDLKSKIMLNVDQLKKGQYEIIIIENGKPIKKMHFTKS